MINPYFNEFILAYFLLHYIVHKDGSVSKAAAGLALCISSFNIKFANCFPLSPSSFTTECLAKLQNLYAIGSLNFRKFLIVSDFQAAILSLISFPLVSSVSHLILQYRVLLLSLNE